ncbi:MAG: apolipoprotein N-acyltransferase [Candidatus Omnitrophota bacterium]
MPRTVKSRATRPWRLSRKSLILSCLSSVLLAVSFPPCNFEFLAWAAFVPLFFALEKTSGIQAFALSLISGAVFWLGTLYWLAHVTAAGMLVLVLYLAFYWGIFGFVISRRGLPCRCPAVFFIPAVWVLLEYIRSYCFTGFPWALLAYSQSHTLAAIQVADITGAWGVSFLVMMANAAIYVLWKHVQCGPSIRKGPVVAAGCILLCVYLYGVVRLHPGACNPGAGSNHVKVSVIQGNIPQELKWDQYSRENIMLRYISLSREAAGDGPDLIVWPEAAVPAILDRGSAYGGYLREFVNSSRVSLLTGAVTSRQAQYYNSAVLLQPDAGVAIYDKIHLVPFGEYIPLRPVLGFLETIAPIGEIRRGSEYRVFQLGAPGRMPRPAFSTLICFEDAFPEISRRFVNAGARFLVTVTNDAWYQRTSAPYQHFQASVFRAVENRVWMARSANTGVSGFIRPDGVIEGLVSGPEGKTIFVPGYSTREIGLSACAVTAYTKFGDWFIAAALLMILLCAPGFRGLPGGQQHQ